MKQWVCIFWMLKMRELLEDEKKFIRRYNRLRLQAGMHLITREQLRQNKPWKSEKRIRAYRLEKKDWGEELQRKRWMRILRMRFS